MSYLKKFVNAIELGDMRSHRAASTLPGFVADNLQYETKMGSEAYGAAVKETKDTDLYGWCMLPEEMAFPHRFGYFRGYNLNEAPNFENWQFVGAHMDDVEYDFSVYGLPRYLYLLERGNPNMVDSLFTDPMHKTYMSELGQMVYDNRHLFVSKQMVFRAVGFARKEWGRINEKGKSTRSANRPELVQAYGFDTKAAYHAARLLLQSYDLLGTGKMEVYKESRARFLVDLRQGVMTKEETNAYLEKKFEVVEYMLKYTPLPRQPKKEPIQQLLMNLYEAFYGQVW